MSAKPILCILFILIFICLVIEIDSIKTYNKFWNFPVKSKIISTLASISLLSSPVFAIDKVSGEKLFELRCIGCHNGGSNLLNNGKSLSKSDLLKYNLYDRQAIEEIITKGAGQMLPYGEFISPKGNIIPAKLDESEIKSISEYVFDSATNNWPKKKLLNRNCDEYPGC